MVDTHARYDIAVIQPSVGVFGGVRRYLEIGNELVRRGHRYVFYHPDGTPPTWLPFHGEVRPLASLKEARHDVVITGEPSLLDTFESADARLKLFYFVLEKVRGERDIVRRRDWVPVANSTGIRARLWKRYRVRAEEAIGGINLDVFQPREAWTREDDTLRIAVYGRMSRKRKGVELVIRAVEKFARGVARSSAPGGAQTSPVRMVFFDHLGPGNEQDPRDLVRTHVPYDFHINLSQEELAALYTSSDIYVSAERRAGWNNTVAEAMACGTPVICTRSGTLDLALHQQTAWVVRWRHPWFLTRALRALHRQPALRDELRVRALEHVRSFTWSRVTDALVSIIERRLNQP